MFICKICHNFYKTAQEYNLHLTQPLHAENQQKYDKVFEKARGTETYDWWIKIRDECNKQLSDNK